MNDQSLWVRPRLAKTPAAQSVVLPLAPSREGRRLQAYLALLMIDGIALQLAFALADLFTSGKIGSDQGMLVAQLVLPLYWTAGIALRAYSVSVLVSADARRMQVTLALAAAAMLVTFVSFALKNSQELSRLTTVVGFVLSIVTLNFARWAVTPLLLRRVGPTATNQLVIDDGGEPLQVVHAYHIDAAEHGLIPDLLDPHMLDRIGLYMTNMDRVIVSCPPHRRQQWALIFKSTHVQGEIVDREVVTLGVIGARRGLHYGSLIVSTGPLGLRARITKRLFDLLVSGIAVILLSPLLLVVVLAILIEDGRPVLFVQPRLGRGNTFFPIYKFRTMQDERSDSAGAQSTARDDERITRVGRMLRRTSIDELPQLFNVLRGEMSLVGPRPHAIGSQAGDKLFWEIDQRYWLRHALKPGVTGLAQIRGLRGATEHETDLEDRLGADLEYLDGWSLLRDVHILAQTLRVVVHPKAY
jgi:polysaccharide biosynthesis protein PslA